MADFSGVIKAIPPVTRTLLIATIAITGPCLLGLLAPRDVALSWFRVRKAYEAWRPLTGFFYGGQGFPLLYDLFMIYRNSSALETGVYMNDTADYAWLHLMLASFILILNIPFGMPFLFRPLLHAQTYTWCRANPTLKVSIFGLITIPTSLYPPALIVLDLITGGPFKALGGLLGLLAGHIWWFISTYMPTYAPGRLRRPNPLATPRWFRSYFAGPAGGFTRTSWGGVRMAPAAGRTTGASTGQTSARAGQSAADAVRHRWGSGQRLGAE
ncbi:hypothetical protein Q5752_005967 [Cryptotrichosporon argae]